MLIKTDNITITLETQAERDALFALIQYAKDHINGTGATGLQNSMAGEILNKLQNAPQDD
jgi:hypothetical protein